jgi:Rod binding domain-containing protein
MVDQPQVSATLGGLGASVPQGGDKARAKAIANDFEAVFLQQMLSAMRQGLSEDSPLGGPDSEFGSLLISEQAKLISRAGGIGVADKILGELLKLQEAG